MICKYSQLKQAAATKEQILAVSKKLGKTPDLICNGDIIGLNRTTGKPYRGEYEKIKEHRDQVEWLEKKYDK